MVRMAELVRTIPAGPTGTTGVPGDNALGTFDTLEAFIARLQVFATTGAVGPGVAFPWAEVERLVARVVVELETSSSLVSIAGRRAASPDVDYLAFHHARVAVMAIRVGANLGWARHDLVALGIAGCLIDFGLLGISDTTLRAAQAASSSAVFGDHPRRGAALVRSWNAPYPSIVDAVLQHHEREQGQGYPVGLVSAAIHPHAEVLGLVDQYTRLTAPPAGQSPRPPHRVIRDIVRFRDDAFPADVVKALLIEVSIFPPGTTVRLNTGETGRVLEINRHQPLRPRVAVTTDAKGRPLPRPRELDLSSMPFLFITRATGADR
jgi:HD-GYP domain-containing protein (c-di-GMP phosphodiesterase class II)